MTESHAGRRRLYRRHVSRSGSRPVTLGVHCFHGELAADSALRLYSPHPALRGGPQVAERPAPVGPAPSRLAERAVAAPLPLAWRAWSRAVAAGGRHGASGQGPPRVSLKTGFLNASLQSLYTARCQRGGRYTAVLAHSGGVRQNHIGRSVAETAVRRKLRIVRVFSRILRRFGLLNSALRPHAASCAPPSAGGARLLATFALGRARVAAVLFRSRPCLRNCCRRDACSFLPRLPYSRYRSVTPDLFCSRPCRPMSRYACFFCARARVFATPIRFRSRPVSRHALSFLLAPMSSLRLVFYALARVLANYNCFFSCFKDTSCVATTPVLLLSRSCSRYT